MNSLLSLQRLLRNTSSSVQKYTNDPADRLSSFLCSYEKAILKTDAFVREMAEFLDISSTENQIKNAIHQIKPGGYMQVSAE